MESVIKFLNTTGKSFVGFSGTMLIQSSMLIIVLFVLNIFLRKKVRVVLLYSIWMLVLVKLVLPTTLSSPLGLGYWIGDKVPRVVTEKASSVHKQITSILQRSKPVNETVPYAFLTTDLPPVGISPEFIADTSADFTAAASPEKARLSWHGFAFIGWLIVVITMIVLLIRRMFIVRGLLAQSKNPDRSMVDIFEQCRKQMGIKRPISLEISPVVVSPSVCGIFRPRILIPQNLPRKLKTDDLRSVLLHELAHIKRGDIWISMIQTILQIAYFYNPLLWMANVIIRKVREQAVDEMVLVAMGEKAEDYPETLLNISRMTFGRPALNLRLIGIVESKKALERRIMIMLSRPVPKSSKLGICGLIAIVVIGAVILPMGYNPVERTALAASFMEDRSVGGIIIPGVRVGDYTLGMSKDDVLRKLGEPETIFYEEERYTLDNLPRSYYMSFGDISFCIHDDAVIEIGVHSPLYKFTNGLSVGDSEQKIKQAFGDNFHFKESRVKDYITYKDKGLHFEIRKKNRTVLEIGVSPIESSKSYRRADIVGKTIVPGLRVGEYTLGMSKDEVLEELGEPEAIYLDEDGDDVVRRGEERYNLNNLPSEYLMAFGDVSFWIEDDSVNMIFMRSPLYKLSNGLKVGDSEQKIKQEFGDNFQLEEALGKDFHCHHDRGLAFQIRKKDQTIAEIVIYKPEGDRGGRDEPDQQEYSKNIIIPGRRVGEYTLGMSKDDVLNEFGEPKAIQLGEDKDDFVRRGEEKYNLNNLPNQYILYFDKISFWFEDDSVGAIGVHSPSYKLRSGLGVGDTKQKVRQTFGEDYNVKELLGNNYLCYRAEGIAFQIHKRNQTISEIVIAPEGERTEGKRDVPDQREQSKHTIVPGVGVGNYMLGMSKQVLNKLGEPEGLSFAIDDDSVRGITVHSPLYKFTNGLGVGDSEQEIKQAFGDDFNLKDAGGIKDFLAYKDKGLMFEIHKVNRTVMEINVYQPKGDRDDRDEPDRQELSRHTIVPGLRVGEYTLGMSKEEVMKKLGEPGHIHLGGEQYTLENLPRRYIMSFGDISFGIEDDTVTGVSVRSPLYKFNNGLGVGNSEEEIKRAFGNDFQLGEYGWKSQLNYEDKGIQFEIRNKDKKVIEIDVYKAKRDQHSDRRSSQELSNLVRQAAADGRISFKLTTPDEFKAIAGRPTREWTESDDELIYLKYPGIQATFFGKPEADIPHMLVNVSCEGRGIDIGRNRPIVLRNEGDLDKFGTFWGYSSVDLSRLDLSQKGELLKKMPFDSRTVWPESDRLPSDFDPEAVMEWGKYPGLGIKKLHDQDVTGKGVHVAIIDQPLLLGHIEYRDQLVSYKEIETGNADPQMHGPPVASILVGKTCGVAPEAILHYWAEPSWKMDYKYRCMALEQIIQFNKGKEKSEQIRVVSVSKGFSPSEPNLDKWKTVLEEAKKSGIYVVHCSSMGFGAGCRFMKDSDNPANYRLCSFYVGEVYRQSGTFFTPIDHRTTASHRARDAYTFWTRSGLSWGAPYYAGVVALGIQVNPNLHPDQIDKLLYDSGWDFQKGKLINPVGFVKAARAAGADG
jgi:beta-lactamase regulating signal transducer with metallopeptidase domain